jgi:hypothetical protein
MNKEQIFDKIDEIYSEHDGGVIYLSEERTNQIKEIIQQAISVTRCCETFTCDVCYTETSNKKDDEDYRYCDSCNET